MYTNIYMNNICIITTYIYLYIYLLVNICMSKIERVTLSQEVLN